jgi:hypothetical protein
LERSGSGAVIRMVDERQHTEQPERTHGHFSEGLDPRDDFPEDEREGRFSVGLERLPQDPETQRQGRFSKGEEALPEEDPEKHVERRFSEGVEASYPMGGSEAA